MVFTILAWLPARRPIDGGMVQNVPGFLRFGAAGGGRGDRSPASAIGWHSPSCNSPPTRSRPGSGILSTSSSNRRCAVTSRAMAQRPPPAIRQRDGGRFQPPPGAVLARVAVLQPNRGGAPGKLVHFRPRGPAVVGLQKLQEGRGDELRPRPSQDPLRGRIQPRQPTVQAGGAQQVRRHVEELEQFLIHPLHLDHCGYRSNVPFVSRSPPKPPESPITMARPGWSGAGDQDMWNPTGRYGGLTPWEK